MKKQTIAIVLGIFLISFASAMYGGETHYKDLTTEIENLKYFDCNLTAQTYDLNGSHFSMNETGWILSLDLNFRPDNLTIDCDLNGEHYTSETPKSPGGSSHRSTYYEWDCSEYGNCINGTALRTCKKVEVNYKNVLGNKPNESIGCYILVKPITDSIGSVDLADNSEDVEFPDEIIEKQGLLQRFWNWILNLFRKL